MENPKAKRVTIAAMFLSAAGLIGIATHEGWVDRAMQPLPGDKWTMGFGSTTKEGGKPVQPGDTTNPIRALIQLQNDADAFQKRIRQCLGEVEMYQWEWDAVISFAYNVGVENFCSSTMAKKFRAKDYAGACNEFTRWTFFQGKDCKNPENKCLGLYTRRLQERELCAGR